MVDREVGKILTLAGITDAWSKTYGQSRTKMNLIKAAEMALKRLTQVKIQDIHNQRLSIAEGSTKTAEEKAAMVEEIKKKSEAPKDGKRRKK
jgi:ribosomal protein S5